MLSLVNIAEKPPECASCAYSGIGSGFTPDWVPENPKVAFLLEAPGADEFITRRPLTGGTGKLFDHCLERTGWSRNDVLLANVLHCNPPGNSYPTGDLRHKAERTCAHWHGRQGLDLRPGGLWAFEPDHFLFGIHPAYASRTWSMIRTLAPPFDSEDGDLHKARRLVAAGHRLLVILGDKAKEFVFPNDYPGGILRWRGHHGPLDWQRFKSQYGT